MNTAPSGTRCQALAVSSLAYVTPNSIAAVNKKYPAFHLVSEIYDYITSLISTSKDSGSSDSMWLTFAQMCVDAHVACSACQALVFTIRYMLVCLRVDIFLCESKVNNVNDVASLRRLAADEEILRLNVTIDQMLGVYILHPCYLENVTHVGL